MYKRKPDEIEISHHELQNFSDESKITITEKPKPVEKKQKKSKYKERYVRVNGKPHTTKFPANVIRNQKYSILTFIPLTLYEQFKYFINFYYLIISLSQLIPVLQVGYLFTYISPLAFVVILAMLKEAYDDIKRAMRDRVANSEEFIRITEHGGKEVIKSSDIKVGHFIKVRKDQRIPADMIILRTTGDEGSSFIRTDQLDGETDWKLRRAVTYTQKLQQDSDLFNLSAEIYCEAPHNNIYSFIGNFTPLDDLEHSPNSVEPLTLENTVWSNTVLASDTIIGCVIYTGAHTRSVMNTSNPSNKKGAIDKEVNTLTIVLCIVQLILAFVMVIGGFFKGVWWLNYFRFIVLISSIIPISMRVNLDFAKIVYGYLIMIDSKIPGCTVRNTGIPEDLGRISYLLSDKTGTLTQNEMIFKKLHMGNINFSSETIDEISSLINEASISAMPSISSSLPSSSSQLLILNNNNHQDASKIKKIKEEKSMASRVMEVITIIALCHNVTPHNDDLDTESSPSIVQLDDLNNSNIQVMNDPAVNHHISYSAASPDEIALVKFCDSVGVRLESRTLNSMTLFHTATGTLDEFQIIDSFPFTSERKRMGIIIRHVASDRIYFLMKGADSVMTTMVKDNDWLDEESGNLAREGLRTLVFAQKPLSPADLAEFQDLYHKAQTSIEDRERNIQKAIASLEENLDLVCLTGVEDKLQDHVRNTIESLRHAGVKVWMLTGDKRETANCIGISTKLISKNDQVVHIESNDPQDVETKLVEFSQLFEAVMIIDGATLAICLAQFSELFFNAASHSPSVICCRCSPTQKAEVVEMIKKYAVGSRIAAIGDGGNDVSMIQAAHIGLGIVGKEGRQASLASDYSVNGFSHIANLLLWHGRNSYYRSAVISNLIIHRGMIISFMQCIFSAIFFMSPTVLFTGMLLFGYSCWYTMFAIFAMVVDRDVDEESAFVYPELYQELRKGRSLNITTFLNWTLLSVYQAVVIVFPIILWSLVYQFHDEIQEKTIILNYSNIIALSFTVLILVELTNIAIVINHWSMLLTVCLIFSYALYPFCIIILPSYYDLTFVATWQFWMSSVFLTIIACAPNLFLKLIFRKFFPPATHKLLNK